MKAVVFRGNDDLRFESVPRPQIINPSDALVRVTTSTICGSDIHIKHHGEAMRVRNPAISSGMNLWVSLSRLESRSATSRRVRGLRWPAPSAAVSAFTAERVFTPNARRAVSSAARENSITEEPMRNM